MTRRATCRPGDAATRRRGDAATRRRGDGQAVAVADPVRVRRLSDQEGQQLLRITRRGTGSAIRLRRAMVVLASAGGNTVPAIARLVQADEDTVRQVIHRFNEMGMASLDPRWAGGRPRQISSDEEQFIAATANTRPEKLGRPFTRWSVCKLADHLRILPPAGFRWGGNGCGRSCTGTGSASSGPRRGRSPPTRSGCSRSTSSAPW
ncbi:helix-turn-helix domain-containing protein [Micromonospora tulbaghiae]|uniref:helix-turn-helix domain-containing protein n=1 Tax=Micromonospora tulbaghiae TaxID=479978 RepID=UPI003F4CBC99